MGGSVVDLTGRVVGLKTRVGWRSCGVGKVRWFPYLCSLPVTRLELRRNT